MSLVATAPLLGQQSVQGRTDSDPAGVGEAFSMLANRSGAAVSVNLYVDSANRASTIAVGLYSSSSNRPASLLSRGAVSQPTWGAWNRIDVGRTALVAGRTYWLAVLGGGGQVAFRDRFGSTCSSWTSARRLSSLPTTWRWGASWDSCTISAYVDSAPPATPTPVPNPKSVTTPTGTANPPVMASPGPGPAPEPTGTTPTTPTRPSTPSTRSCFAVPSACGYPDATNSGVPSGITLSARSGNITAGTPGEIISGISLTGSIDVTANNVTIKDTRIVTGDGQLNGTAAIRIENGVSGTVVQDTTMQGSNCTSGALFAGVLNNSGDQLIMNRDYGSCLDDILHGSGTIENSYSIDNANIPGDHYEPVAYDGGAGSITVEHNTLLNPHDQTAAVFVTCFFGPVTSETIDDNLMAGGGYVIYGPTGNGACDGQTGHQEVKRNRFSTGYFPNGGQYGAGVYFQQSNTTWSGNYWDGTLASVGF